MRDSASAEPYGSDCPAGCGADTLAWTDMALREGACAAAAVAVSACTETRYWQSWKNSTE